MCNSSTNLKETLHKYWNHSSFRPLQENIITDIINGKDTLAILPTGGGKSICYQLPALILQGTCIVVSPLIALINDQIASLKRKGITGITIPSNSNTDDIIRIFDNIKVKKIKLLYLSPERMAQPLIQEKLQQLNISFIAIDEAHCISQWGHDFRPSYLKLTALKEQFPQKSILAVTATATPKTQEQIIELLKLKDTSKHIGSFNRKNLAYQVFETPQKFDLLCKILKKQKAPTIIYLQNRLATVELSNRLQQQGYKSTYYHAGLSQKEREINFKLWDTEQQNIMIATSAFGMGIDKSNVRLVIHLETPSSIENYLQEAGRAGRDEKKSFSCVILSKNDFIKFHSQALQNELTFDHVLEVYLKLNQYYQIAYGDLHPDSLDFDLNAFANRYKLNSNTTSKALRKLDSYGIITYQELYKSNDYIKVTASSKQLLAFCDSQNNYRTLIETLLRNYTGIFDLPKKIDMISLAKKTKLTSAKIYNQLTYLNNLQLIHFEKKESNHCIQVLVPREDKKTINPFKKGLTELTKINQQKNIRTIAYFENETTCRNKLIANYFDENPQKDCGICDICTENTKAKKLEVICKRILEVLKSKPETFNDLMIVLKTNSITLKKALKHLLNEELIQQYQQYFKLT